MRLNADVATCVGKSGRRLTLLANTPGVQFYTGNFMDGTGVLSSGKEGVARLWNYAPRVMDDGDADCDEGGEVDLNSPA